MGIVVTFLTTVINYTVLNAWLLIFLLPLLVLKLYSLYSLGTIPSVNRMDRKTVIITGGNSGIGFETAQLLAERGARVILACRNMNSAQQAKAKIIQATGNENIETYKLDLSSLWSVRQFASEVLAREKRLDVLINNAGAGGLKNKKTDDDLQITWQINHLAPFLLTNLLLGLLKKSAPSRIIFVSSFAHHFHKLDLDDMDCHKPYGSWTTYCNTKLANILTAKYLAKKLENSGVTVNSLHPGFVDTPAFRRMKKGILQLIVDFALYCFAKSPEEGAATTTFLAVDHKFDKITGKYFSDCKETRCQARAAQDMDLAERLCQKSEELIDLKEDEKFF